MKLTREGANSLSQRMAIVLRVLWIVFAVASIAVSTAFVFGLAASGHPDTWILIKFWWVFAGSIGAEAILLRMRPTAVICKPWEFPEGSVAVLHDEIVRKNVAGIRFFLWLLLDQFTILAKAPYLFFLLNGLVGTLTIVIMPIVSFFAPKFAAFNTQWVIMSCGLPGVAILDYMIRAVDRILRRPPSPTFLYMAERIDRFPASDAAGGCEQ